MKVIKRILQSPILNIIAGVVLLITSGFEVFEVVEELAEINVDLDIGSHHGLFIYSIIHLLRIIPEIVEGAGDLNRSTKYKA